MMSTHMIQPIHNHEHCSHHDGMKYSNTPMNRVESMHDRNDASEVSDGEVGCGA